MVRGAWHGLVGRTVVAVFRAEMPWGNVVHLCFSDGTCFEVFGAPIGSSRMRFGSIRQIGELLTRQGVEFDYCTKPAPPLDPRDVDGPDYIGYPDPDVVKMDGER